MEWDENKRKQARSWGRQRGGEAAQPTCAGIAGDVYMAIRKSYNTPVWPGLRAGLGHDKARRNSSIILVLVDAEPNVLVGGRALCDNTARRMRQLQDWVLR